MDIKINIKNKIAELAEQARVVCGNSDYTAVFSFDEEWAQYRVKTARFAHGSTYTDVVFEGDRCPMPVMRNVTGVYVGVFAGDLSTTTPAYIACEKSILCHGGAPAEPTPDVYAAIMAMVERLTRDGTLVTIDGEFVESLAVDNYVSEFMARLVDNAPETLNTLAKLANAIDNNPEFAETVADELKRIVTATDTALEGKEDKYLRHSTNLFNLAAIPQTNELAVNAELGEITISAQGGATSVPFSEVCPKAEIGKTYYFSYSLDISSMRDTYSFGYISSEWKKLKGKFVLDKEIWHSRIYFYPSVSLITDGQQYTAGQPIATTFKKIMLNEGDSRLDYEPYYEPRDLAAQIRHIEETEIKNNAEKANSEATKQYFDYLDAKVANLEESIGGAVYDSKAYTDNRFNEILGDGGTEALDTLAEIAKALGEDPNFATTILKEIEKKGTLKGEGALSIIQNAENIAQDTWAAALNKDTAAYGGGSLAGGGGSIAGVSLAKYKEIFAEQLEGKTEDEIAQLYAAARERNTVFDGKTFDTVGFKYWFAIALGELTEAIGRAAFAEGYGTDVLNDYAHGEGYVNKVRGVAAHGEGGNNEVDAIYAHVEGESNHIYKNARAARVGGLGNHVYSPYADVGGRGNTVAEGAEGAFVRGGWNTITDKGKYCNVHGQFNEADASMVYIEGLNNKAKHTRVHIEGQNNESSAANQHIIGKYSKKNANAAVIVGGGTGDAEEIRKNIYELDWNGNAKFAGDVYAKGGKLAYASEVKPLYQHMLTISGGEDVKALAAQATFISYDDEPINSFAGLLTLLKERGYIAASGMYNSGDTLVTRIGYSYTPGYENSITIMGVNNFRSTTKPLMIGQWMKEADGHTIKDIVTQIS